MTTISHPPKAMTLIEIMVSLVILGLLVVVLFQTYGRITQINTHIQLEQNVQNEIIYLQQVIQNLVDTQAITDINDNKITFGNNTEAITIRLTDGDTNTACSADSNDEPDYIFYEKLSSNPKDPCGIEMIDSDGTTIPLTSNLVHIVDRQIRGREDELKDQDGDFVPATERYNNGFFLSLHVVPSQHNSARWANDVDVRQQSFFNSRIRTEG